MKPLDRQGEAHLNGGRSGLVDESALLALGHASTKGLGRAPLGRGTGRGLLHHEIDLLERQTLGLGHQEVGVDKGAGAESEPDVEHGRDESADHVRRNNGNDAVPEPVGGGGQSNTAGPDGQREDLTNDDPGTGTPGGGKGEDEDGNEGNLGVDGVDVVGSGATGDGRVRVSVVEANGDTDGSNNKLADQHGKSTPEQERTAAPLLDTPEGERRGQGVDDVEDDGHEELVGHGTGRLEEGRAVVEDEVDTGPLLHHLERGAQNGLAQVGVGLPERALEAGRPGTEPGSRGNESLLVLLVGDDLSQLVLDVLGLAGLATEPGKSLAGLGELAALDKVTGRVGQEDDAETENGSPDKLQTDGQTVGVGRVPRGGLVGNASSNEQTNGDAELVAGDEGTTDLAGALQKYS